MYLYFRKIFLLIPAVILILISSGCADECVDDSDALPAANIEITQNPNPNQNQDPNGGDESDSTHGESGEFSEFDGITVFSDGFAFAHNGENIFMGEYTNNIIPLLGVEPEPYFADSCTSEGMMVSYVYGGFELQAYAKNDGDDFRVFSVVIHDDSVTTPEGVYIGSTVQDMINAYGEDYEAYESMPGEFYYRYTKNGTALSFDFDGDVIIYITYLLLVIV